MWALGIVVAAPFGDLVAGVAKGPEPVEVQALVAHLAVKALHESVLHRLAWLDELLAEPVGA